MVTFSITASCFAQEQEGKLIDRLLRPNLALENSAQNKKFESNRTTVIDKPAPTRSFPVIQTSSTKTWTGDRALSLPQFPAPYFRAGDSGANISTRSQLARTARAIATPAATAGTRVASESGKSTAVHEYSGVRPFLGTGKSQKALQTQNKPLTIEQVRELLNKGK
jgi:hypothetical protein